MPNEVGFDSTFFVKFLCKQKVVRIEYFLYNMFKYAIYLLPIGGHSDFKLSYFRGDGVLTKNFLIKIVKSKKDYEKFLPDEIKLENLSKDFLFSVIAHVDPKTYSEMYELYKKKISENIYKKWEDYTINIKQDMIKAIDDYVPSKK